MLFDMAVIRSKLKGLNPNYIIKFQIISHAFLMTTGFASSIVFALLLSNKEELLVSVAGRSNFNIDPQSTSPVESPVQNNNVLVMTSLMVILIHSGLCITSSAIFLVANRCQFRSEMVLSNKVQVTVLSIAVVVTFFLILVIGILRERIEFMLTSSVPTVLVQGLPLYLTILAVSIMIQICLMGMLFIGRFHFTQLVEEDEEVGQRTVRLEITADASPAVNVHLPSENKTLKQVKSLLTLPGRDRIASLRSLHKYDPSNNSPGLYAVPLTPFDAQSGMWSANVTTDKVIATPTRGVSTPNKAMASKDVLNKEKDVEKVKEIKDDATDPNFSICTDEDSFDFELQNGNNTL